jgi:ABC-type oligopeptide transport system substrate-binding subunit
MFHFLQIVASSVLLPVSSKMDQLDPAWAMRKETILCNGPFCLEEWQPRQQLSFAKNPLYHGAKAVQLNRILVDIIEREMPVLHMHASGHFDLVGTPLSFFPSEILQDLDKRKLLTFFPVAATKFLAFNTSMTPFHNANIRKAFGLAISRKSLVEHITRLKEEAALNVISPILTGESNTYFADGDRIQARKFFQKGLEELQLTSFPPLIFIFVPSEINKSLAQALQQMWLETLGVTVILEQTEFKELHSRSQKGTFSLGIFAWVADYADPMNILERFADKTNHRNYPKWENGAYNQLLTEIRQTTSKPEYLTKVKQAEELLIEEMPFTCLFHENYAFLVHPHVKGLEISPLGHIYFERISIDHSRK